MNHDIIVALIALLGTLFGSFGGIVASSKLTAYRLQMLEEKVDKHNRIVERIPVTEEKIKVLNHRVEDLERMQEVKNMPC